MDHLLKKIEKCRHEMIKLSNSNEWTSETVVKSSEKLDMLVMEYYRNRNYKVQQFLSY